MRGKPHCSLLPQWHDGALAHVHWADMEGGGVHLGLHALGLRLRLSCLNCFVDGDRPHGVHAVMHAGRHRGDLRLLRVHPRPALRLHASSGVQLCDRFQQKMLQAAGPRHSLAGKA